MNHTLPFVRCQCDANGEHDNGFPRKISASVVGAPPLAGLFVCFSLFIKL